MKLTKTQLKRIIKEELEATTNEGMLDTLSDKVDEMVFVPLKLASLGFSHPLLADMMEGGNHKFYDWKAIVPAIRRVGMKNLENALLADEKATVEDLRALGSRESGRGPEKISYDEFKSRMLMRVGGYGA